MDKLKDTNLGVVDTKLTRLYRAQKAALTKTEKKYLHTPTEDLKHECSEKRGVLVGIQTAINVIHGRMNDNQFVF